MKKNPHRRALLLACAGAAGLWLAGCVSAPRESAQRRYTETISSVLISQDQRHMVVIGKDDHYIFEAPPLLVRALQSPADKQFAAEFTPFHVDKLGAIAGEVTLRLPAGATPEAQRAAAEVGLARQDDGSWAATTRLAGRRYASWTYRRPSQTRESLGKTYTVEITTDETPGEAAVHKAVTPVRVAADGVNLVYYAALAPIILPIVFLTRARDR